MLMGDFGLTTEMNQNDLVCNLLTEFKWPTVLLPVLAQLPLE